jgi:hypothetical protein
VNTTDEVRPDRRRRPQLLLWVFGGLVAAAVVVGAIAGVLRGPARLAPDSPERTVQTYLEAVLDSDHAAAAGYLSEEAARRCPASAFRETWVPEGLTAELDGVRTRDGQTDVRVRLRSVAEPFALDDFTSTETFSLVEEDGVWRLTGEPWPLYACAEPR